MKNLCAYNYKGLFLPDYIREKSSFNSELWSLVFNKLLLKKYLNSDIRSLLNKRQLPKLFTAIEELGKLEHTDQVRLLAVIKKDAIQSFNDLASIINGEQQNLYVNDRLNRLNIPCVFLSGVIDKKGQISKIEFQLAQLNENLARIRRSYKYHGTNIQLTYRIEKLSSDLTQASDLIQLCKDECTLQVKVSLIKKLIERNIVNRELGHYISTKSRILTKTIVEHNSNQGEKYIAHNVKEYVNIFKSSLIGGLLIAVFAFFKIEIESWEFSLLGEGLLFGANYALCFILVDILGGIIATKQPAMTANTLLSKIDAKESNGRIAEEIANVFADVSKSQFISFLGNLSVAFVVSIAMSYLYAENYDRPITSLDKGDYLLSRNNIFDSGSFFYAAIAGVFLSISGFIAGYMDNAVLFYELKERVNRITSEKPLVSKFYNYLLHKIGKFSGSFSLGMFLGLAGAIGMFSGIPFDIRHVAFSSAHIAYGSQGVNLNWLSNLGLVLLVSIFIIGLVNFIVSFTVTLMIAIHSKSMRNKEILKGFVIALQVFFTKPWLFILPVKFSATRKRDNSFR